MKTMLVLFFRFPETWGNSRNQGTWAERGQGSAFLYRCFYLILDRKWLRWSEHVASAVWRWSLVHVQACKETPPTCRLKPHVPLKSAHHRPRVTSAVSVFGEAFPRPIRSKCEWVTHRQETRRTYCNIFCIINFHLHLPIKPSNQKKKKEKKMELKVVGFLTGVPPCMSLVQ